MRLEYLDKMLNAVKPRLKCINVLYLSIYFIYFVIFSSALFVNSDVLCKYGLQTCVPDICRSVCVGKSNVYSTTAVNDEEE